MVWGRGRIYTIPRASSLLHCNSTTLCKLPHLVTGEVNACRCSLCSTLEVYPLCYQLEFKQLYHGWRGNVPDTQSEDTIHPGLSMKPRKDNTNKNRTEGKILIVNKKGNQNRWMIGELYDSWLRFLCPSVERKQSYVSYSISDRLLNLTRYPPTRRYLCMSQRRPPLKDEDTHAQP